MTPYITAWSAEQDLPCRLVERADHSIGYVEELLTDRDQHGVLWQQTALGKGHGRPEFGRVHPLRQRRTMELLLCQVCGGPADRNEDGVLWLQRDHRDDWPHWPEGMALDGAADLSAVRLGVAADVPGVEARGRGGSRP